MKNSVNKKNRKTQNAAADLQNQLIRQRQWDTRTRWVNYSNHKILCTGKFFNFKIIISPHFQIIFFISERQKTRAFLFPNPWTERFSDSCRNQTPGRRCGHFWYGLPSYSWISLCYNGTSENSRSEAHLDSNFYGFCEIRLSRW